MDVSSALIHRSTDTPAIANTRQSAFICSASIHLDSPSVDFDLPVSLTDSLTRQGWPLPRAQYDECDVERVRRSIEEEGFHDFLRPIVLAVVPPHTLSTLRPGDLPELPGPGDFRDEAVTLDCPARLVVVHGRLRWKILCDNLKEYKMRPLEEQHDEVPLSVWCELYSADIFDKTALYESVVLSDKTLNDLAAIPRPLSLTQLVYQYGMQRNRRIPRPLRGHQICTRLVSLFYSRAAYETVKRALSASKLFPGMLSFLSNAGLERLFGGGGGRDLELRSLVWTVFASTSLFFGRLERFDSKGEICPGDLVLLLSSSPPLRLDNLLALRDDAPSRRAAAKEFVASIRREMAATSPESASKRFKRLFPSFPSATNRHDLDPEPRWSQLGPATLAERRVGIEHLLDLLERDEVWEEEPESGVAAKLTRSLASWEDLAKPTRSPLWRRLETTCALILVPLRAALSSIVMQAFKFELHPRLDCVLLACVDEARGARVTAERPRSGGEGGWAVSEWEAWRVEEIYAFIIETADSLLVETAIAAFFHSLSHSSAAQTHPSPFDNKAPPGEIFCGVFSSLSNAINLNDMLDNPSPLSLAACVWVYPTYRRMLGLMSGFARWRGNLFDQLYKQLQEVDEVVVKVEGLARSLAAMVVKGGDGESCAAAMKGQAEAMRYKEEEKLLVTPTRPKPSNKSNSHPSISVYRVQIPPTLLTYGRKLVEYASLPTSVTPPVLFRPRPSTTTSSDSAPSSPLQPTVPRPPQKKVRHSNEHATSLSSKENRLPPLTSLRTRLARGQGEVVSGGAGAVTPMEEVQAGGTEEDIGESAVEEGEDQEGEPAGVPGEAVEAEDERGEKEDLVSNEGQREMEGEDQDENGEAEQDELARGEVEGEDRGGGEEEEGPSSNDDSLIAAIEEEAFEKERAEAKQQSGEAGDPRIDAYTPLQPLLQYEQLTLLAPAPILSAVFAFYLYHQFIADPNTLLLPQIGQEPAADQIPYPDQIPLFLAHLNSPTAASLPFLSLSVSCALNAVNVLIERHRLPSLASLLTLLPLHNFPVSAPLAANLAILHARLLKVSFAPPNSSTQAELAWAAGLKRLEAEGTALVKDPGLFTLDGAAGRAVVLRRQQAQAEAEERACKAPSVAKKAKGLRGVKRTRAPQGRRDGEQKRRAGEKIEPLAWRRQPFRKAAAEAQRRYEALEEEEEEEDESDF